jgi:hypothetical protein
MELGNEEWDVAMKLAMMAAQGRSWRGSADCYRKAYVISPKDWHLKYCCISGYTAIFKDQCIAPTPDDLQFLKNLGNDENALLLVRTQACFSRGLLRFASHDREGAARSYRKAIRLASNAAATERSAKVVRTRESGEFFSQKTAKILDDIEKHASVNLKVLEGKISSSEASSQCSRPLPLERTAISPLGPNATIADFAAMAHHRSTVSGGECDACARPAGAGGAPLRMRKGCSSAWYCSRDCQAAHWPAHMPSCGPLKPGALAVLCRLERRPDLNGRTVRVVGRADDPEPAPAGPGDRRWHCAVVGGEAGRGIRARERNLQRLCPLPPR